MKTACPECALAEQVRDGRVDAAARAAWMDHMATCAECTAEWEALERLAGAVRVGPTLDPFSMRRLRDGVVAGRPVASRRRSQPRRRLVLLGAGLAAAAALALVATTRAGAPPAHTIHLRAEPLGHGIAISADDGAVWSRAADAHTERILLMNGVLTLGVISGAERRFVVQVPDGEIQDVGTVFRVAVRDGRTRQIDVTRGAVVFRRPGKPDVHVAAGTVWRADDTPPIDAPSASALPTEVPATPSAVAPKASASHGSRVDPAPASAHEDELYMHIVALVREGRRDEASAAAKEYLRRYPQGFRSADVRRLAR